MKYIKIPEEKISITNKQQFNGLTYLEILKKVDESEIASYELLQRLRNTGKYKFLKNFWVFVPNPDKKSKKDGYVARFFAGSGGAVLNCYRNPEDANPSGGVFLIKELK